MAQIRGYIAASVDGFIADAAGSVSWLKPFESVEYGYSRFIDEIGTVVMGRKTYEQARSFGPEWVYPGKRSLIVASKPLDDRPPDVEAWSDGVPKLLSLLRTLDDGDAWIVGGSQLQSALIQMGGLDRLELFVIPILLGDGVPLFHKSARTVSLTLSSMSQFDKGIVCLDYRLTLVSRSRSSKLASGATLS